MKIKSMHVTIDVEGENGIFLHKDFRFVSKIGKYSDYLATHYDVINNAILFLQGFKNSGHVSEKER